MPTSDRNRRIARNTVMLYTRSFFMTIITLYTSRVVLSTLGVEDFGIYDVVGGVVVMLSFFISSLSTTTQRFLNCEMGHGNSEAAKSVFSTALACHLLIALLIVTVAETAGLWFIKNQLHIPANRMDAAIMAYHFSIAIMLVAVVVTPFNAMIIAHERMNIYACVSVADAVLRLITVYILQALCFDKLAMYAVLQLVVTVFTNGMYVLYCRKKFGQYRFVPSWNITQIKKLMSFSGWIIVGQATNMFVSQGINMLINIFFGPLLNAARNIATQVQGGMFVLMTNILTAARPQIIKSYTQKDYPYACQLAFSASKLSFMLLYLVALPLLFHTEYILQLWLKEPPDYAAVFIRLILIDQLFQASFVSVATVSQASGKIKRYQIIVATGYLLEFCFTALFYRMGYPVYSTFIIAIIISFMSFFARLCELRTSAGFPVRRFLTEVSVRLLLVAALSATVPLTVVIFTDFSILRFCAVTVFSIIFTLTVSWSIGFSKTERNFLKKKIKELKK